MTFEYREPAKIVADVIQQGCNLSPSQVLLAYQKILIPTPGPLVVVRYLGPSKVICSVDAWAPDPVTGVLTEIQTRTMLHLLQVDVMSYDATARGISVNGGIEFSINSLLSEAQQEMWQMNIAKFPGPFLDTSFIEETAMINCFTTTLKTTSVNQKMLPVVDYYTDFSKAVPPQLVVNA